MAERGKREERDPQLRNLTQRGGIYYYERVVGGRRYKFSTKTGDPGEAVTTRDLYEARKGIGRLPVPIEDAPRLRAFAARYLREDTAHLAATTRRDRPYYLAEDGPILAYLGDRRLDEITPALLRQWWAVEIERPRRARGRSRPGEARPLGTSAARHYLNTLAAVLAYAQDLGLIETSPIPAFREQLRRRRRTKRGRVEAEGAERIRPIEDPAELARLVKAAQDEGREAEVAVLLLLDAGLRLGEALGLRWGAVVWGQGAGDPRRALVIDRTRPRGGAEDATKSGRSRRVALSRRLRAALEALSRERWHPGPDAAVLEGVEAWAFRAGPWRRICTRAGVGARRLKDLRDTFASQLLTAGVQLGYVSAQLGHADVGVTARHYARWAGGESYREPMALRPGEVPADFLARVGQRDSHQSPTTPRAREAGEPSDAADSVPESGVLAKGSEGGALVRQRGFEPPRGCPHQPLKLARLPIPPLPRGCENDSERIEAARHRHSRRPCDFRYGCRPCRGEAVRPRRRGYGEGFGSAGASAPESSPDPAEPAAAPGSAGSTSAPDPAVVPASPSSAAEAAPGAALPSAPGAAPPSAPGSAGEAGCSAAGGAASSSSNRRWLARWEVV